MNLAAEPQNNKLAEIGGIIRLAQAMKAAALGAPTAVAAQAMMDNLKALSIEAGLVDPSGNIAKMIYNFVQEAYKRVEQLATEEAAAQSSREGIMGDPVRIDPTKEPLAAKLEALGRMSPKIKEKLESIDPKADIKVVKFEKDAMGDFHPAGEETLKGARLRESAAIVKASGELSKMHNDVLDGKTRPGTPEYAQYLALKEAYNMQIYGQKEEPNPFKRGLTAKEKADAEALRAKGHERLKQAIIDLHGHTAAEKPPQEREAAGKQLKGKISSADRLEDATKNLAQAEAANDNNIAGAAPNTPAFVAKLSPEEQAAVEATRQSSDVAAAKNAVRSANTERAASTDSMMDEWAEEPASPGKSQEQNIPVQLATGQDNAPTGGSPLPAGAPTVASTARRR